MEKITNCYTDYSHRTVYLEKSDCSYWTLGEYEPFHNWYLAKNNETGQTRYLTPVDLLGNWVI